MYLNQTLSKTATLLTLEDKRKQSSMESGSQS